VDGFTITNGFHMGFGGGIYIVGCNNPTIKNCVVCYNDSSGFGGVYCDCCSGNLINTIIHSNNGQIYCNDKADMKVINCTVLGAISIQIFSTVKFVNSSLWGCEIRVGDSTDPSSVYVSYSNMDKNCIILDSGCYLGWGAGNINANPLFVDLSVKDCHLTFTSPCKDAGSNSAVGELYDFEGDPRIAYGTADMGADEFYTHLYWTGDGTPGGNVDLKFVGLPGTKPVGLCIGSGVLSPPLPSMWGDWYLQFPILGPVMMPSIPSTGVSVVPGTIPGTYPSPASLPMQALIGAELTNLSVLEVK
jgi:hypothetical protein